MSKGIKQYNYDTEKVKDLIRNTDLTYRTISKETGCPYATVVYHGRRIRGKVYEENSKRPAASMIKTMQDDDTLSFSFTKENISIYQYEDDMKQLVQMAEQLGAHSIDITIKK
ncbi:hypothetical protein U0355_04125 [Salimicrobium sp. PL1-032A]|uniref:hypothetical protein n=1 Tax=Salimicrobium sp. PL1-032A TaxID=3095364 RepID=UPI00325FF343